MLVLIFAYQYLFFDIPEIIAFFTAFPFAYSIEIRIKK